MKKRVTLLFAMFAALVTTAMAQISVSPLAISQDGTAELIINFNNTERVKGIQFTLKLDLPAGVTVKTLAQGEAAITYDGNQTYTPGNGLKVSTTNRTKDWWVLGNKVSDTEDIYNFVLIDPTVAGLEPGNGSIMKINFEVVGDINDIELNNNKVELSGIHESIDGSTKDFEPQADESTDLAITGFIKGDVNNNGQVDIGDVVCVLNYIVGRNDRNNVFIENAANVNGDLVINIGDVVRILQRAVGKIESLSRGFNATNNLPDPD